MCAVLYPSSPFAGRLAPPRTAIALVRRVGPPSLPPKLGAADVAVASGVLAEATAATPYTTLARAVRLVRHDGSAWLSSRACIGRSFRC